MQVSVTFDPTKDSLNLILQAVRNAYALQDVGAPDGPKGSVALAVEVQGDASAKDIAAAMANQSNGAAQGASPLPGASTPSTAPTPAGGSAAASSAPVAGAVELDSTGLPWDARIHSSGVDEQGKHKKTAKGVWNKRKGCTDDEFDTVSKELLSLMAAQPMTTLPAGGVMGNPANFPHQVAVPVPGQPDHYTVAPATGSQAPQQPAPAATAPAGQSAPPTGAAPVTMQTAPVLPAGVAPMPTSAPMPTPAPIVPHDFITLAQWIAPQMEEAGGKLKQEHVEYFCRQCQIVDGQGVGQFALVANRPDAISWLYDAFKAQIAAAG